MSTNPETKSYHRRIERLASKLSSEATRRSYSDVTAASSASLDEIIKRADPTMPKAMRLLAIALAVKSCEDTIRWGEEDIASGRSGIDLLEEYKSRVSIGPEDIVTATPATPSKPKAAVAARPPPRPLTALERALRRALKTSRLRAAAKSAA
jgi:hypothetical protein